MNAKRIKLGLWTFSGVVSLVAAISLLLALAAPVDVQVQGTWSRDDDSITKPLEYSPVADAMAPLDTFDFMWRVNLRQDLADTPVVALSSTESVPAPFVEPASVLRLKLVATALESTKHYAVFIGSDNKVNVVSKNESIEEATVIEIATRRVTLDYHGNRVELELVDRAPLDGGHP